jgi:CBS domain-containing protein
MICPTCGWDNVPGNEACSNCQQALSPLDRPSAANCVERSLMEDQVLALRPHALVVVKPDASIRRAIDLMLEHNVGVVLVVGDSGKLVGIFSERDLLKKVAGIHNDFAELPVSRFMTAKPESVGPTDTLNLVLNKMDGGGYRHVPVVDDGKPVSVVSVRDMLRHITRLCDKA